MTTPTKQQTITGRHMMPPRKTHRRKLAKIEKFILNRYEVTLDELFSNARPNRLVWPRWVYWNLLRADGWSLHKIGDLFKMGHTTVLHGVNRLHETVSIEPSCRRDWDEVKKEMGRI